MESKAQTLPQKDRYTTVLNGMATLVALAMIAFHVLIVWHPIFGSLMNQNAHLGFAMVLIFLAMARGAKKKWLRVFFPGCAALALGLVTYMAVHYERLDMFAGFPEPMDVVVGVGLIILVLVLTWRAFGYIFPSLVMAAIAYAIWGHHLPGVMATSEMELGFIVSNLSVGFQGIYGMLLNVSVNVIFLLVIFGSIFEATGVTRFFMAFGALLGRYLRGGSGQTAIFSSSFVGMVNGVAAANVAVTGSYTIPVMKESGFTGEQAAAIEAMASTGGQLTPPIMGIAVFIMANFLGITYAELIAKALIPAIAYYAMAVLGVILLASRRQIPFSTATVDFSAIKDGAPLFLIPIATLTLLLFNHYTVGMAASWSICALLLLSALRRATRPAVKLLLRQLVAGAILASTFAVATACIGMLVKSMTFTGMATKLAMIITTTAGNALLPALFMVMLLSIFLSASTPTVIAYVVVAFLAAPVLGNLGVEPLKAHLFVFYFAVLAAVTPPIAGAAIVGSQIAKADYMKTSWESFKLVGPFYILPYFAIKNPVILMEPQPLGAAIMAICALAVAMGGMTCIAQQYCLVKLSKAEMLLCGFMSIAAVAFGLYHLTLAFMIAVIIAAGLLILQVGKRKKSAVMTAAEPRIANTGI